MWFCKKAPELACVGCGCLMRKARKTVESWDYGIGRTLSYCGLCAPPYDVKRTGSDSSDTYYITGSATDAEKPRFYREESAKEIEVTEKGKPIS